VRADPGVPGGHRGLRRRPMPPSSAGPSRPSGGPSKSASTR
jgi:hypothetical protein